MAYLLFGWTLWALADALSWAATTPELKIFFSKTAYLGIDVSVVAFVIFALHHLRRAKIGDWRYSVGLGTAFLPSILLLWTNESHRLFWTSFEINNVGSYSGITFTYGVGFWLHTIFSYSYIAAAIIILFVVYQRSALIHRKQLVAILIAAIIPVLPNLFFLIGIEIYPGVDLTPFTFGIASLILSYAVFRYRMLRVFPVARREVVENIHDAIVILDSEFRITDLNASARDLFDVNLNEVMGRTAHEVVAGLESQKLLEAADEANFETDLEFKNQVFRLRVSSIQVEDQRNFGYVIFLTDISRHRQAQTELEQARIALESVVDSLEDPYFEADPNGIITFANLAFIRETKYEQKSDVIGQHFRRLTSRRSVKAIFKQFVELYETKEPIIRHPYEYRRRDGTEEIAEITVSPIFNEEGDVISTRGIIRDISERIHAEKTLRLARDAAEHRASELAAINRVATIVNRSLDLNDILEAVCLEYTRLFPVRNAGIALLNADRTHLDVVAFHTVAPDEESALGISLMLENNLASQEVIDKKKTIQIADIQSDPRTSSLHQLSRDRGSKSMMIVPLLARSRAIGTIGMPAKDLDHTFSQSEIQLAETLASQIATAVENARLHTRTESALGLAERDLEIGRQIQSGFFPEALPQIPKWDIAARFEGARQVAGDFYDIFRFKNSNRVAFIIADVCDKGVGAALFMVLTRSLLRAFSENQQDALTTQKRLHEIVLNTNNFIAEYHGRSNMFATLFIGILDPDSGRLDYINAGHDPPFISDAAGTGHRRLMPSGPAVGLFPDMTFEVRKVQFQVGDVLVAFTDGATDAKNPSGDSYSEERLLKSLQANALEDLDIGQSPSSWPSAFSILYNLHMHLRAFIGSAGQYDDITLVAIRRCTEDRPVTHLFSRPAEMERMADMRDFVENAGSEFGLGEEDQFAFKLAAEEIIANLIQHGYEGLSGGQISLAFERNENWAILTVRDTGRHYDPVPAEGIDISAGSQSREIGGLGLFLIHQLMDEVSYSRDAAGVNVLTLKKHIQNTT